MAKKAENKQKITALYCRLSVEDIKDDDKNSKKIRKNMKIFLYNWENL